MISIEQLKTVERVKALNAQHWADFKKHWPMEVLALLRDIGFGFLAGVALSLSLFVYLLDAVR
jgi:hypothetical protein